MAGPNLPTNRVVANTAAEHLADHNAGVHPVVNLFDLNNTAGAGVVPVGNGTVLVTRALLSTDNPAVEVNTRTGSYTAVAADAGKEIEMNVAAANNLTIPSGIFAAKTIITWSQYGAGLTTLVAGPGMTLRFLPGESLVSLGQYASGSIRFRSTTEAVVRGKLAVVSTPSGPTAPAAATSAGYTTLAFNDDFDSINTIDFAGTAAAGQGYKWTAKLPFDNSTPPVTSANTTVSNSVLTLRQSYDNYNQGLFTVNRATQTNLAGPFQYGYYEARMKFDPSLVAAPSSTGWPSFWSMGATHLLLSNDTRWPELDFFEFAKDTTKASGGVFAASIHDHDKSSGTETDRWNSGNNTVDVNPATWNDWHNYGCLWQPNSIKWYFDGTLIKTQTYTSTAQTPAATNGNAGTYTILDSSTAGPAGLCLGTGSAAPLYIDWVRVWH